MTTTDSTPAQPAERVEDEELVPLPRRHWYSLRLVHSSKIDTLAADLAQADKDVKVFAAEAERWHGSYCDEGKRADDAEDQVEELRRLLDEKAVEADGLHTVIKQVTRERDLARQEHTTARAALDEIGREVAAIKTAAEDPVKGETVRAAIALGVLRRHLDNARALGRTDPWFDLLDLVLYPATDTADTAAKEPEQ